MEAGAKAGLEATCNVMAKCGKAAIHAAKAAGQIDQGAFAGCCMVTALCGYICRQIFIKMQVLLAPKTFTIAEKKKP